MILDISDSEFQRKYFHWLAISGGSNSVIESIKMRWEVAVGVRREQEKYKFLTVKI